MLTRIAALLLLLLLATACPSHLAKPGETSHDPAKPDHTPGAAMTTPTSPEPARVVLEGETVTISVVGEFLVGHGRFRLRNLGSESVQVSVTGLWFEVDGQRRPLELGSVHDVERGENLDAQAVQLAPGDDRTLLIAFPPFVHEPGPSQRSAVVVQMRIDDSTTLEASSPLRFERRIPRRSP